MAAPAPLRHEDTAAGAQPRKLRDRLGRVVSECMRRNGLAAEVATERVDVRTVPSLYHYAWFIGFLLAFVIYWVLMSVASNRSPEGMKD